MAQVVGTLLDANNAPEIVFGCLTRSVNHHKDTRPATFKETVPAPLVGEAKKPPGFRPETIEAGQPDVWWIAIDCFHRRHSFARLMQFFEAFYAAIVPHNKTWRSGHHLVARFLPSMHLKHVTVAAIVAACDPLDSLRISPLHVGCLFCHHEDAFILVVVILV